jgi:hypothetical protein
VQVGQPPYNLIDREIEADLIPFCKENGIHLMTNTALCRGLLSGKLSDGRTFSGDDLRKIDPKFKKPRLAQYLAATERLDELSRDHFNRGRYTWWCAGSWTMAAISPCGVAADPTRWPPCLRFSGGAWIRRP